jgi:hypothetical protein
MKLLDRELEKSDRIKRLQRKKFFYFVLILTNNKSIKISHQIGHKETIEYLKSLVNLYLPGFFPAKQESKKNFIGLFAIYDS